MKADSTVFSMVGLIHLLTGLPYKEVFEGMKKFENPLFESQLTNSIRNARDYFYNELGDDFFE